MTEEKLLELLRLVGGLEYITITHVDNIAVRDRLITKINELDKALKNLPKGGKE